MTMASRFLLRSLVVLNRQNKTIWNNLTQHLHTSASRCFLSEAYRIQSAWDARLESPLLKSINLDELFYEIDQKLSREQNISHVDVDLFANAVRDDSHLDEMEDLVHRLRLSASASRALPSTSHALLRAYLDAGNTDALVRVLHDRLNYGVFPDYFIANILLDTFIENKQYLEAAKVGVLQMLQEDYEHPLTTSLSVLACVLHVLNPRPWDSVGELPTPPEDPNEEEIKVRVSYLRNPYFDDHFDLREGNHLVGKTLAMLSPHLAGAPSSLSCSLEVLGWTLYEKWDRALESLKTAKGPLLKQALDMAQESLKTTKPDETNQATMERLQSELNSARGSEESDVVAGLEAVVQQAAKEHEASDMTRQMETYKLWEKRRAEELASQLAEVERVERLRKVEETKKYLREKEEHLYFFDNEKQWELTIEEKKAKRASKVTSTKKRATDEDYMPPELRKGGKI